MAARTVRLAVALTASVTALTGCGGGSGSRAPDLAALPLIKGTSVVTHAKQCDRGAHAFCALELVVVDLRFKNSADLLEAEHRRLRRAGWSAANGDTGEQHAAESPGQKLRVTYATADGDLKGIDLGWIQRPRTITLALSRALFDRRPTLSLMLENGSR